MLRRVLAEMLSSGIDGMNVEWRYCRRDPNFSSLSLDTRYPATYRILGSEKLFELYLED